VRHGSSTNINHRTYTWQASHSWRERPGIDGPILQINTITSVPLTMFESFVPDAFFCVAWMTVPDYLSAHRRVELPAELSGLREC